MCLKVVGTRRVTFTSSKRRNELRDYKRHFYKSSSTWCLSLSVLMCQIFMHTPQIFKEQMRYGKLENTK